MLTIYLKRINRSVRFCNDCTKRNNNIMEDEEHAIFGCPEYITCRLKYPELFNLSENIIKDLFNIDHQESISKFLWDFRNIRVDSGSECYFLSKVVLFLFYINDSLFGLAL